MRGPLPPEMVRWNGFYVIGDRAVLSYTVQGTDVLEQPGSVKVGEEVGITRAFRTLEATTAPLTLAAEVPGGTASRVTDRTALIVQGDTVTAVRGVGAPFKGYSAGEARSIRISGMRNARTSRFDRLIPHTTRPSVLRSQAKACP